MGSSNGVTRGQLRPHFSGRSPPFLLAALCVGLGILGVSYWSLSQQYNDLEEQLKKTLLRKESIESELTITQTQLNQREDGFSRCKKDQQKTEQDLNSVKTELNAKEDRIRQINSKIDDLNKDNANCKEELNQKTNELGDAVTKLKDIEQQKDDNKHLRDQNQELSQLKIDNKRLEQQLFEIKQQLFAVNNATKTGLNIRTDAKDKLENSINEDNSLKSQNSSVKVEEPLRPEVNPIDDSKDKIQEQVIAEPVKPNQSVPSNDLGEDDRKEESLVDANDTNNELSDDIKADPNKDIEENKSRAQF